MVSDNGFNGSFSLKKAYGEGLVSPYGVKGVQMYDDLCKIASGKFGEGEEFYLKALDATTDTGGTELTSEPTKAQIIQWLFENNWMRQAFPVWPMRNLIEYVPKIDSTFEPDYKSAAYSGDTDYITEDTPTTTRITLSLKALRARMKLDKQLVAYSTVPNILNVYKDHIKRRIMEVEEDCFVNGDTTTGTSNINYTYDATDHPHGYNTTNNEFLISQNGLRKSAGGTAVDAGSNAFTLADIRSALRNLGIYGRDRKKVTLIVSPDVALTMLSWTQLETWDKYKDNATIFHGEIGRVTPYGIKVIETDKLPNTTSDTLTDTTGARSATLGNNLYTEALVVYQDAAIIGLPTVGSQLLSVTVVSKPDQDRDELVGSEDIAFGCPYTEGIVRIYNILP